MTAHVRAYWREMKRQYRAQSDRRWWLRCMWPAELGRVQALVMMAHEIAAGAGVDCACSRCRDLGIVDLDAEIEKRFRRLH
jgi:hypothetical protein